MCLVEEIGLLHKLHVDMRCRAVGQEFSVNELTLDIKQSVFKLKHTHTPKLCDHQLMKM